MTKRIIFLIGFMWCAVTTVAQKAEELTAPIKEVSIGHRVPQDFWTKKHLFFVNGDTVYRTLEEHKGKLIVLDFWFSGCTRCFLDQKEIKYFKEKYQDSLVVIMVNSSKTRDSLNKIQKFYESDRFRRIQKETQITGLISIVEDTYLTQLFPYTSYPHYVWINMERLQLRTWRNLLDRNYKAPFIDSK